MSLAELKSSASTAADSGPPEGWVVAKLCEVVEKVPNAKPEDQPERTFRYVDISSIDNRGNEIVAFKEFKGKEAPSRARRPIKPNDILFSNVRTYLRNIAIVPSEPKMDLCSTGFTVLRSNDATEPRFLFRQVLQDSFINNVTPEQTGTLYPATSDAVVMEQVILLPPLAEQRRIVAKLEQVLAAARASRKRLARVPALMKRFRQSVLAAACAGRLTADWREQNPNVEPASLLLERILAERRARWEAEQVAKKRGKSPTLGLDLEMTLTAQEKAKYQEPETPDFLNAPEVPDLPESWEIVSVEQVTNFLQYGTSTKTDAAPENGIAVLRMGNIQNGELDYSDLKYLDAQSEEVAMFLLQTGDILFNRTNSPELVGKSALYKGNVSALFASYLVRLRCSTEAILPSFICHWINSSWGREWAKQVKTDGVSQSNINATKLSLMPVPLAPLAEQQEIVRRVEALFKLADAIERRTAVAAARADRLVQAVLAKAFRGELVPTEAELARAEGRDYEPASALLARIQAERAATPGGRPARNGRKPHAGAVPTQEALALTDP